MPEEKTKEKGLDNITIWLMIGTALFFDVLQLLLDFILMGWLITIFAFLTFTTWFTIRGISLLKLKRVSILGIGTIVDFVPVLGALAWTATIVTLALDSKIKKGLPAAAQKVVSSTPNFKKAA